MATQRTWLDFSVASKEMKMTEEMGWTSLDGPAGFQLGK